MNEVQVETLDGGVHLWWFTDEHPSAILGTPSALDVEELDRARRFRRAVDRRSFLARRRTLRQILARYVSNSAAGLTIDRTCERCGHLSHGRPRLVDADGPAFSTSSRSGWAVVAVADASSRIGVDVDVVDPAAAAAVSTVSLTTDEHRATAGADDRAVVRLWCRKEALVKSSGFGLIGSDPARLDVRDDVVSGRHLRDVWAPAGRVAAIATVAAVDHVVARRWPDAEPLGLGTPTPS